jgi:uncharacterized protein
MRIVRFIALLLIVIGALNWGLVGFFKYNAIASFSKGDMAGWSRFFYAIIGIAGVWSLSFFFCPSFYSRCFKKTSSCSSCHSDDDKDNQ